MPQPQRSRLEQIQLAIADLPEPTRTVYRLHLLNGHDYLEIGALLRLSSAEVERHIANAIVAIDGALRTGGK